MSLLANQSYANPSTPLWVSAGGDTITGDLTVTGTVAAEDMEVANGGNGYQIVGAGPSTVSRFSHIQGIAPRTFIQSNDPIYFNQLGQVNGNTYLQTSAPISNNDILVVGGDIGAIDITLNGKLGFTSSQVIGTSRVPVGATNVTVPSTAVTASSFIVFTRPFAPAAGPGNGAAQGGLCYNPANIVPGVSFQVDLVDPATGIVVAASTVDAEFAYLIIN